MIYKYNEKVDVKEICDLRQSVGWNRMEKEMADPRLNSYYHIAVYEEENQKLIGFVDSVSNGVTDAYIQDLMVHPDFQDKGLGSELMNKIINCIPESTAVFCCRVIHQLNCGTAYTSAWCVYNPQKVYVIIMI